MIVYLVEATIARSRIRYPATRYPASRLTELIPIIDPNTSSFHDQTFPESNPKPSSPGLAVLRVSAQSPNPKTPKQGVSFRCEGAKVFDAKAQRTGGGSAFAAGLQKGALEASDLAL